MKTEYFPAKAPSPDLSADALRGKQSVRVTFRLPEHVIALLSSAASRLGVQQKALFDHLVENEEILDKVAEEGRNYAASQQERVQKTYVISRDSLLALKNIAKEYKISRDLLVELSINRLQPVLDAERQRQHSWENLVGKLDNLREHGRTMLNEAREALGEDDLVLRRVEALVDGLEKGFDEIAGFIDRGRVAEKPEKTDQDVRR